MSYRNGVKRPVSRDKRLILHNSSSKHKKLVHFHLSFSEDYVAKKFRQNRQILEVWHEIILTELIPKLANR